MRGFSAPLLSNAAVGDPVGDHVREPIGNSVEPDPPEDGGILEPVAEALGDDPVSTDVGDPVLLRGTCSAFPDDVRAKLEGAGDTGAGDTGAAGDGTAVGAVVGIDLGLGLAWGVGALVGAVVVTVGAGDGE